MFRSLIYFWRLNTAVLLGAAVASAVLTGALLVGDSMRGSLRDLALDRLGRIEAAILSERFLRTDLAAELSTPDDSGDAPRDVAPVILLRGAVTHAGTEARASRISVIGFDDHFTRLFPDNAEIAAGRFDTARQPGQVFPSVILNRALQKELGASAGDQLLLSFPRAGAIPRATIVGRRDPVDVLGTLRCTVAGVVEDRGPGRFGLTSHQTHPLNAFVSLVDLQRVLDLDARANVFLVASSSRPVPNADAGDIGIRLASAMRLDDLGLTLQARERDVTIGSAEFVLRDRLVEAIDAAADHLDAPVQHVLTYLANLLQVGQRKVPYSMLTAIDPRAGSAPLLLVDGTPAPPAGDDGILLNSWAADDLDARVGDPVKVTYFVLGERDDLREETTELTLRGIVAMEGLGADRSLTPRYPGIEDARSMAAWDPPFPVDLRLIGPRDEAYWERYRTTPKAFVSESLGRRLWHNRFGTVTGVRLGIPAGLDPATFAGRLDSALRESIDPAAAGIMALPVRAEGLRAAAGATDFSGLFFGFSMFLIGSAAMLSGLLFRLGVEQRAREIGTLLAVGYPIATVRRRFLVEGVTLAALGALLGTTGGIGYAWLLMAGLRTLWLPAVGSSMLFLHMTPLSLALGVILSIVMVVGSIASTVRRLGRVPAARLLAGSMRDPEISARRGRFTPFAAWGGLGLGVTLTATALLTGATSSPGLSFGTGTAILISGLAFFGLWCRRRRGSGLGRPGAPALVVMAARNSAWNPGRSILSVSLIACASFVIIAVAALHRDPGAPGDDAGRRDTSSGGYTLVAEADIPLYQDLNSSAERADLGFSDETAKELRGVTIQPFRFLPGDDASCLNLYRPGQPRVLGVPPAQIRRGGFRLQRTIDEVDDPWTLLEREIAPGIIPAFGDANSVQWILHLGLGQDLVLEDDFGQEIRLRIVGLLADSVFQSELLIAEEPFVRHFPSRSGYSYFLIETPVGRAAPISAVLEETLRPFGFDATPIADKLAGYHAVQNTYLSTFQMLGGLGLLLGTLGLGIVLIRNVIERRGELAALRAFGYRRARLAAMVLAENGFLLLFGLLLGSVSGLLGVTPHLLEAGNRFPWLSLFGTIGAVLPIGMLASLAAVKITLGTPLLPALKAER